MIKKGLSETRISEITGIPLKTFSSWKKDKNSYRAKLYWLIKTSDESFLIEKFKDVSPVESLKEKLENN